MTSGERAPLPASGREPPVETKPAPEPPPARLGTALKSAVQGLWDHLGLALAISLTFMLLLFLPLGLALALPLSLGGPLRIGLAAAGAVLALAAPAAGGFYVAQQAASQEEAVYADMWHGARKLFGPALRLGALHVCILGLFAVNLWFYLRLGHLHGSVAAMLCSYALLVWGMMAVYQGPLLVAQETGVFDEPERRARRGALAVVRRSFYLMLGHVPYSLALLGIVGFVMLLLCAAAVPAALLGLSACAFLTTYPTRALLIQHGILSAPTLEMPVPDEKFRIKA